MPAPFYRFNAVQDWLTKERLTVETMLSHVRGIERIFLSALEKKKSCIGPAMLLVPSEAERGRFLCFQTNDAAVIKAMLAAKNIIVDNRGDRLRIGFGIYHNEDDALRLTEALAS